MSSGEIWKMTGFKGNAVASVLPPIILNWAGRLGSERGLRALAGADPMAPRTLLHRFRFTGFCVNQRMPNPALKASDPVKG